MRSGEPALQVELAWVDAGGRVVLHPLALPAGATLGDALAAIDPQLHPRFKKWCDEYFHNKHRQEPRGIGGTFFDDLSEPGFERCFAIQRAVGDAFLPAYEPIVLRRRDIPYGERERDFQA
jgi:coproporphyrinogen III oxidase